MLWLLCLCLVSVSRAVTRNLTLTGPAHRPINASHNLHPSLASFSIETAFFIIYIGNVTNPNTLSQNLLQNLADRTGVPAEIRIGGITADSTYWDASLDNALFNFIDDSGALRNTTIGPPFWEAMELLPKGTKLIFNLDLHDGNYTGALVMAEAAMQSLPPDQLIAFEIGNEPDHYGSLTPQSYADLWEPWTKNISDALNFTSPMFQVAATADDPLWPYGTPAAARQLDCVSALAAGADNASTIKWCSEHTYQYSVCDPARTVVATLPNLVNHTRLAMYLDLWQPRIISVREEFGPDAFVIGEYNSVSCSGRDGVSNTFGQALWLLDTTFYAASLNVSRLYIHQGGPLALQSSTQLNHGGLSLYDMWYPIENLNGPVKVFPSYSTYLFVTETLGHSRTLRIANIYPGRQDNGSTITTALGDTSAGQLVVYGFWDDAVSSHFPTKLALINLEIFNSTQNETRPTATFDVSTFVPPQIHSLEIKRLAAPGAEIKEANITFWAGQTFEDGLAKGRKVVERVRSMKIRVEASSAALVSLI